MMSSRWNGYALPCAALLALTGTLSGQDGDVRVSGFVVEEANDEPVPGTLVILNDGRETVTDAEGRFLFPRVRPGGHSIAAVAHGCAVVAGDFEVSAGQDKILKLVLSRPEPPGERKEQRAHSGKVLTGEQLRRSAAPNLLEALRDHIPGIVSDELRGRRTVQLRGRGTLSGDGEPFVVFDGVRVEGSIYDFLSSLDPDGVERVEVYAGAAGGWIYGPGGAPDGVIVITSLGAGTVSETTPPEECRITWKEG